MVPVIGIIVAVVLGKYGGKVYQFVGKLLNQHQAHPGEEKMPGSGAAATRGEKLPGRF